MPAITVTQSDRSKTFDVRVGDRIIVSLEENPTTGYRWAVEDLDDQILTLLNSDFSLAGGGGVGGGGQRTCVLTTKQPGTTEIILKLWRDWVGDSSVIDRFNITVKVSR